MVAGLRELGTRELTLMGGEVYLRPDALELIRAVADAKIRCTMLTGGRGMTEAWLREARAAGLQALGVSIDGPEEFHDAMRGVKGSFEAAIRTLRCASALGLPTAVNTQVTPRSRAELPRLAEILAEAGARYWRVGLVFPIGNAADHPELITQPYEVAGVIEELVDLFWKNLGRGPLLCVDDGLGYYGPGDHLLRSGGEPDVEWLGCPGGTTSIGIDSEGHVKACTSLSTVDFGGDSVREAEIASTWRNHPRVGSLRHSMLEGLWGFCKTCYYREACLGGCTCSAHAVYGRRGNNSYCQHRVLELKRQGLRERLEIVAPVDKNPYGRGVNRVVLEQWDGSPVAPGTSACDKTEGSDRSDPGIVREPPLVLCQSCQRFVWMGTRVCPFCHRDLRESEESFDAGWRDVEDAKRHLADALRALNQPAAPS